MRECQNEIVKGQEKLTFKQRMQVVASSATARERLVFLHTCVLLCSDKALLQC